MKYTDAQHREVAKKLVRQFNDFDDLYDEAKSEIRPMMDEKEWDHFLDILGKEWKASAKDSVSPVPVAGKHANGCPFCKANHDPGIPCRNSQPRTGLTKPQLIKRDGKLLGVNMVPVGDAGERRSPRQPALPGPSYFPEKGGARYEVQAGGETKKVCHSANECIAAAKEVASYMGSAHTIKAVEIQPKTYKSKILFETKGRVGTKATDSITLSRDEARTLLSVIKQDRARATDETPYEYKGYTLLWAYYKGSYCVTIRKGKKILGWAKDMELAKWYVDTGNV